MYFTLIKHALMNMINYYYFFYLTIRIRKKYVYMRNKIDLRNRINIYLIIYFKIRFRTEIMYLRRMYQMFGERFKRKKIPEYSTKPKNDMD